MGNSFKPIPRIWDPVDHTPLGEWNPILAGQKLDELYNSLLAETRRTIKWYHGYRKRKGRWAKGIRIVAILFLVASTLMPYFASMPGTETTTFLYIGYLLAGLGGGLLLLDRYFGFSNSWIRFVLTGMDLEARRDAFIHHWQIVYIQKIPLTVEGFCYLVNELSVFAESFRGAVRAETQTWASEFQQSLKELIAALKAQSDQMKNDYEQKRKEEAGSYPYKDEAEHLIPESVFREAIKQNAEEWINYYELEAVSFGKKIKDGETLSLDCLVFIPAKKLQKDQGLLKEIPSTFLFKSVDGKIYELPTDVRASGGPLMATASPELLCEGDLIKRPGCSISRKTSRTGRDTGTISIKVYKKDIPYLLGCYHVFCAPELRDNIRVFDPVSAFEDSFLVSPSVEDSDEGILLGNVIDGELSPTMDGALMSVKKGIRIEDRICYIDRRPGSILAIEQEHADNHLPVLSVGRTSGFLPGWIQHAGTTAKIRYEINGKLEQVIFQDIILSNQKAKGGDSGALVIDNENSVIGILIASSGWTACIIPIQRYLNRFNVTIKPTT